jgi:hypothetical protein
MAIMKDLPVSKDVKAGALISNDNLTLVRAAKPAKDLPASKDIKAGRKGFQLNDNVTLIRAAKPAKDLTTGKDVKGGRKK